MSRQIWKFTVPRAGFGEQEIMLPMDARVLAVQPQDGRAQAWVLVSPENGSVTREWVVVGTGWDIPDGFEWAATWQEPPFVWHLLERQM